MMSSVRLDQLRHYFEQTRIPNVFWFHLAKLDFLDGALVLTPDPDNIELAGKKVERSPL